MSEGIRLLKTIFTTSLPIQPDIIYRRDQTALHEQQTGPSVQYEHSDAIAAVNLAHLTGEWSILPTAFYMCCQLDVETLVRGKAREGGTPDVLGPADLIKCIEGRKQLLQAHASAIHIILDVNPLPMKWFTDCKARDDACRSARDALYQDVAGTRCYIERALWSWEDDIAKAGFCPPCRERFNRRAQERVGLVWLRLARLFSLDHQSWKRLVLSDVFASLDCE